MSTIAGLCVRSFFCSQYPSTLMTRYSMWFKYIHKGAEPSRIPNVICFSIILSLSLTGAMGLAIRAASGGGFCEEFLSAHPEKCREAGLAIAMSCTSVIFGELGYLFAVHVAIFSSARLAIAGILVSWLDKHPGAVEVRKLYAPQRPAREIELLRQQSTSEPTNVLPPIHVSRPPASHATSRPRGPLPARTLPGHSQRILSANGPAPLMLNRTVHGPVGQTPRNRPALTRIEDLQALPSNVDQIRGSAQTVDYKDMWKVKFLNNKFSPF